MNKTSQISIRTKDMLSRRVMSTSAMFVMIIISAQYVSTDHFVAYLRAVNSDETFKAFEVIINTTASADCDH